MSKTPGAVAVWPPASLLVHVTGPPTTTVATCGEYWDPSMRTLAEPMASAVPPATARDVTRPRATIAARRIMPARTNLRSTP